MQIEKFSFRNLVSSNICIKFAISKLKNANRHFLRFEAFSWGFPSR